MWWSPETNVLWASEEWRAGPKLEPAQAIWVLLWEINQSELPQLSQSCMPHRSSIYPVCLQAAHIHKEKAEKENNWRSGTDLIGRRVLDGRCDPLSMRQVQGSNSNTQRGWIRHSLPFCCCKPPERMVLRIRDEFCERSRCKVLQYILLTGNSMGKCRNFRLTYNQVTLFWNKMDFS